MVPIDPVAVASGSKSAIRIAMQRGLRLPTIVDGPSAGMGRCAGANCDWSPFPQEIGRELASDAGKARRALIVGRLTQKSRSIPGQSRTSGSSIESRRGSSEREPMSALHEKRQLNAGQRRALELLADAGELGCTGARLFNHGFTVGMLADLVWSGVATGYRETVRAATETSGWLVSGLQMPVGGAGARRLKLHLKLTDRGETA
jgi:hypothetical protein